MKPKLSSEAIRPFTSRECSRILGSIIGGLTQFTPIENVRDAVRWWAETDKAWEALDGLSKLTNLSDQE